MTIIFSKYKIKSNNAGWMLQKKRGNQWKKTQYFNSLGCLLDSLLKETFNEQTGNLVYYIANEDDAVYMLETVNELLKAQLEEIRGVLQRNLNKS